MTKSNVLWQIETDAGRYGFYKKSGDGPERHKIAWAIKCSKCPMEFRAYWPPNTSPALMVKNMRVRHWDIGQGERPLCPTCAHKKDRGPDPKPAQQFEVHVPELPKTKITEELVREGLAYAARTVMPASLVRRLPPEPSAIKPLPPSQQVMIEADGWVSLTRNLAIVDGLKAKLVEKREKLSDTQQRLFDARRERMEAARKVRQDKEARRRDEIRVAAEAVAKKQYVPAAVAPPRLSVPHVEIRMTDSKSPTPSPKIAHVVFQQLDAVFSAEKRLYNHGWTDQRVAKECGTSEDVVAYLRTETFGQLAEDPRISALRDDIALMGMEAERVRKEWEAQLHELRSRVEQMAAHFTGR
jgi:hypothetical protein